MRVISGKYKGKKIIGFDIEGTRPTMDRVKESIFSMIQFNVKNSVFLDLFAGSGAIGIEALSNGAKFCYFVDYNIKAINTINKNLTNMEDYKVMQKDYKQAIEYFSKQNIVFDVIFLDPPYKFKEKNMLLNMIYEKKIIKDDGIIVFEYEDDIIDNDKFVLVKQKKYGKKIVDIYKKREF